MTSLTSLERRYLLHSLFSRIGLSMTDLFGGFLLYEITGSIGVVLAVLSVAYIAGFVGRVVALPLLLPLQRRFGGASVVAISLALLAAANIGMYVFRDYFTDNLWALATFLMLWYVMNGFYYLFANAMKYAAISAHALPGSYSSYLEIVKAVSYITASIAALWLNAGDNLLWLLVIAAVPLSLAVLPLRGMPLLSDQHASFRFSLRTIFGALSMRAKSANIAYDIVAEFVSPIIPLFLILAFAESTKTPVEVTGLAFIASTVLLYASGILKDRKNPLFTGIASIVFFLTFFAIPLGVGTSILGTLLILFALGRGIVTVAFDAELSREFSEGTHPLEAAATIETMRAFGGMVIMPIFLLIFLTTGGLPPWIFVIGALAVLPFATYALKGGGGSRRAFVD